MKLYPYPQHLDTKPTWLNVAAELYGEEDHEHREKYAFNG
jgi:hypothetical protein